MGSVLRFSTFFALVGALAAAIHFYLYRRLIRDTTQSRRVRQWGLATVAGLSGVFIATRVLQGFIPSNSQLLPLFSATWFWMGLATYLSFALWSLGMVRWLARAIGRLRGALANRPSEAISPERRLFLSRAVAGGAVLAAGGLTTFGAWRAYAPAVVSEIPVRLPRLSPKMDGCTIVQLSDLHLSNLIGRHFVDDVVRRSNALKPDMVVVTGDLVDGLVQELGGTAASLMNLHSRYGTFFVTGNHDYYSGASAWCEALTKMGVNVLRNRFTTIGAEDSGFDLVGVDDWGAAGRSRKAGYDLDKALWGRDPDRPAVLLAPPPPKFTLAPGRGMGLPLSGHTHAGQFFPVTAPHLFRFPPH